MNKNFITMDALLGEHKVVKSNKMVKTHLEITKIQTKLLCIFIAGLKPNQTKFDWQEYRFADIWEILGKNKNNPNKYRILRESLEDLMALTIRSSTGDGDEILSQKVFLLTVKTSRRKGVFKICFEEPMKSHLLNLRRQFTVYHLWDNLKLESTMAIRLFEYLQYCKNLSSKRVVSLKDLRGILKHEQSYQDTYTFKKYIERALQEISKKTGLQVKIQPLKTGNRITSFKFSFEGDTSPRRRLSNKIKTGAVL